MNKIIILILSITVLFSCKNESKSNSQVTDTELNADQSSERTDKQKDGLTLLKGDFLYLSDAAVLQTHQLIYGVIINEKMHELNDMVSNYKKEDTDMIPVEIRGVITPKPSDEEGWEFRVEIKEIINVSEPDPERNDVIKLGN